MMTLTPEQALEVMFCFLQKFWDEFSDAEVRDVLSDIQPARDGETADPAAWFAWMECVRRVARAEGA